MSILNNLGVGLGAAGDLLGGIGEYNAGNAAAGGYSSAAALSTKNAQIAAQSSALDVIRQQRKAYKVIGGIRADVGASGLLAKGSALDVLRSSASEAALDTALIRNQGQMDVNKFTADAASYTAQAQAAKSAGKSGGIGGFLSGAASLLALF